jgi:outer membrane usher protein
VPHRRRWPFAERLLAALLFAGMLAGVARAELPAGAAAERLVLAVSIDGVPATEPVLVRRAGATLWMRADDLRALGVPVAGDAAEVALAGVPGLTMQFDAAAQSLALSRPQAVQRVRIAEPRTDAPTVSPTSWGASLDYDLTAARTGRYSSAGGVVDAVVFGPRGHFFAGAIVSTARYAGTGHVTRLDTGFTAGDPRATRRLTIGDMISGAAENSRPVRLGGIQIATDFDLRPDLITYPVPAIAGSAAVPSALDLIVDGSRRSAGEVRAGQFAVTDVPVHTGVNAVTVAVRDALGRETRQTVSTYVSRALLRPGLTAYSVEAGFVRTGYATTADSYRDAAASATLRVGMTERLTVEAHTEVAGRVGVATFGGALGLGGLGLASAGFGVSVAAAPEHHGGAQWSLGFERVGRPVSVAVRYLGRTRGWYDLASDGGAGTRDRQLSASLGFDLARFGTLGVTIADQGRGRVARPVDGVRVGGLPASTFATATYSVRIAQRLSLTATAGTDTRRRRSGYLSIGALLLWGRRDSAQGGVLVRSGSTSGTLDYVHAALEPGDVGYRVSAARGGVERIAGEASYQGASGFYLAQVERTAGVTAARVSARGALVLSGGTLLMADRLGGSFAVVDAQGQANVPVLRDHRVVGRTNRSGKLVVTNLRPYERTRLALDPMALGDEVTIDTAEQQVVPAARTGVPVRFGLQVGGSARVRLVDGAGAPIAAGARAVVNGSTAVPVGFDGELYAGALRAANTVVVTLPGGATCRAAFARPAGRSTLRPIGPVACTRDPMMARAGS